MRVGRSNLIQAAGRVAAWLVVCHGPFPVAAARAEATATPRFRAACVKVDITPDTPQWLHGYAPRRSEGVHDRIYHRIALIDDGTTTFCLVSSDICTISPLFYHACCKKLEGETGLKPGEIWWSTTHTHSAPHLGPQDLGKLFVKTLGDRFSITLDTRYSDSATEALRKGIVEARSRLEPARLGVVTSTARANVNRRQRLPDGRIALGVNPDGPVDRQLGLIRLERPDGTLIGLIANYAIHATALGGGNKLISGDVTGWAAEYVERRVEAPLLFINGAEGNVAPLHSVGSDIDSPLLKEYDSLLGEPILAANASMRETTAEVSLAIGKVFVETPLKPDLTWPAEMADYGSVSADGTRQVRVPVYSLTINRDTVLWAAPLELFSEIAIRVRESSPFVHTLYCGLTNGSLAYLPTKEAFRDGGYEPGVSPFTERAETDFTFGVTRHLRELSRR